MDKFYGIAVFNPVMNGVGGNLVAVQASRLSTALHQLGKPGQAQEKSKFYGCIDTFFGGGIAKVHFDWNQIYLRYLFKNLNYKIEEYLGYFILHVCLSAGKSCCASRPPMTRRKTSIDFKKFILLEVKFCPVKVYFHLSLSFFFWINRIARPNNSSAAVYGDTWKSDIFVHNPRTSSGTHHSDNTLHLSVFTRRCDSGIYLNKWQKIKWPILGNRVVFWLAHLIVFVRCENIKWTNHLVLLTLSRRRGSPLRSKIFWR